MLASDSKDQPAHTIESSAGATPGDGELPPDERFRPLPTGSHGLDPNLVKDDQRERLQRAMIELIAEKGYPSVRIVDLAKLAHVSQPSFYNLYADKEELFLSAYEGIAGRTARTVIDAYQGDSAQDERAHRDARVRRAGNRRAAGDVAADARRIRSGLARAGTAQEHDRRARGEHPGDPRR